MLRLHRANNLDGCDARAAVQQERSSVVEMVDRQGRFAWYELLTTDVAAAQAFYRDVVGWDSQDATTAAFAYNLFTSSNDAVAGLMDLPEEGRRMEATPRWIGIWPRAPGAAVPGRTRSKKRVIRMYALSRVASRTSSACRWRRL